MIAIAFLFVRMVCDCFKSRRRLDAELLGLRHQLNVLRQRAPCRLNLRWADRALTLATSSSSFCETLWRLRVAPADVLHNPLRRRFRVHGFLSLTEPARPKLLEKRHVRRIPVGCAAR